MSPRIVIDRRMSTNRFYARLVDGDDRIMAEMDGYPDRDTAVVAGAALYLGFMVGTREKNEDGLDDA